MRSRASSTITHNPCAHTCSLPVFALCVQKISLSALSHLFKLILCQTSSSKLFSLFRFRYFLQFSVGETQRSIRLLRSVPTRETATEDRANLSTNMPVCRWGGVATSHTVAPADPSVSPCCPASSTRRPCGSRRCRKTRISGRYTVVSCVFIVSRREK